ncbi:hypothetical protein JD77_03312 [Micromonospora olivasterospora]|uniref:Uncharacterized protein n=1 Tax=Micromonospora olivasterospora TaxID=1880 RepID=A0A562IBH5_MICOL|nr:hypothetical protein JD77_03312 [Micromonospora olivasterospora]
MAASAEASTASAAAGSSPSVGSSRTSTRGAASSARASARRCRWPPESWPPSSPTTVPQPAGWARTQSSRPAARVAAASSASPAPGRPSSRFSRTVAWKTYASASSPPTARGSSSGGYADRSTPSRATRPLSGRTVPVRTAARVLLPAPLGPTTATLRPAGRSRVNPSSAGAASAR